MADVINFGKSIPTNFFNGVARTLSASPTRLASFGMTIPTTQTDVILEGAVGVTSTAGSPEILFKIFRGTQVIGTALLSTVAVNETRNLVFSIIDENLPTGFFPFRITAEILNDTTINQATVVGPISLSGFAIQK